MTILAAPLAAAALCAFGGLLLLVHERKGARAGRVFLGTVAVCIVFGLAVTAARSPNDLIGSSAQAASRTMVE